VFRRHRSWPWSSFVPSNGFASDSRTAS
jgi:hypothetical protein